MGHNFMFHTNYKACEIYRYSGIQQCTYISIIKSILMTENKKILLFTSPEKSLKISLLKVLEK